MNYLSDEMLLKSYIKAHELDLNQDFINIIKEELIKRSLDHLIK